MRILRRARCGHARRQRGFTLIEMIAAFVIFAIAIGSLMQILSMSVNNTRRSLDETRASLWAQSLLDNVGIGERIEAGRTSGEFDRNYRWEMNIELVDPQTVEAEATTMLGDVAVAQQVGNGGTSPLAELPQMELFHVELLVVWGGRATERSARFTTLRLTLPDLTQGSSPMGSDRSQRAAAGEKGR
jgi:general secretion pathway protein I